uniref:Component of inner membrane protein importcomplex n=1 Tax=Guilandina bonduc TaxID=191881 RepID=A0A6H0EHD2_GUIBO|nr:component of inner membrane protein importcomplex [Guilandina bonduc]QIT01174.1 component of inner membrane protein importcomplex [Guilandina bonduc]
MIFKSFILDNLVSLCMKIINSVVVVGLYYGFLTTFSIGPSYLFLLRARVMEEGTEKKVSATTGFITGQLMMFISIYYAPLHLALGRPHTITVIALPYLLFLFFCNNHKHFLNYGSTNQNSMRNFSIQKIFLNNLLFQLLNLFILPSSMLVRLVNIYMFRCNNQLLFLTSSFIGWLIGHILLMKWVRLVLVWIQQNNSIKSNVLIRSNKYIMSELRNSMFIIFLFITCLYYLGRTPSPIFIKKKGEIDNKIDVERTSKTRVTKKEQNKSTEEYLSPSLFSEEREESYKIDEKEEKDIFRLEKPLLKILFDYKRFHRPLRYIKNDRFENAVRDELSQFFFHTCQSDAKEKISFTYPSSLSTFLEMMQRKMALFTTEKLSYDELDNHLRSINEQKRNNLSNKFLNRAEALDKEFIAFDVLEKRIRLCNDETKKKYLPKIYDPFLNGPYRGRIKKSFSLSIKNKTYTKNSIWINKIHGILLNINTNYPDFEQKMDPFDKKSLSTEIPFFFNLISKFSGKSISNFNFKGLFLFPEHEKSEDKKKKMKLLFDAIITDPNDKTIRNRKKCIGIKETSKKVPRWSYKLIDEVEYLERAGKTEDYEIRSRKAKRVVILTNDSENHDTYTYTKDTDNSDEKDELALIRYSQLPDFRRDIIKGSRRVQRRKTVTWKLFQASAHSLLFLDKIDKPSFFSFDIFEPMKFFFRFKNGMWKNQNTELKISDYTEEKTKEIKKKDEEKRIEIAEAWDSIIYAQVIRGFLLVTQSIIRKYILLPSLIITKNIVRILLFQFPEWSEDLKDWNREMYIKCTYNAVPLSETEFPKNWLTEGIQIKILFPFRLKPWHKSKLRFPQKEKDPMKKKTKKMDFCFLTVFGMEVELPFSSSPRNRLSFFDPIFKELKKKIKNWKKKFFLVLKVLNERTKFFLNVSKEKAQWIIKSILKKILFLKEKIKKLSLSNLLVIFGLRKIYELNKIQKDSTISNSNPMIYESAIPIQSINWTNYSLTEKKIKNLNDRRKTIIKQIEKITKDKKKGFLISERNICSKKTTYDDKRLELQKNIWQILQRRNVRLARKSHYFLRFFMQKVYMDIFVCIINIPRMNVQLFLESTKKKFNKYIEERIDKKNQRLIHFISTIKKSIWNISNRNSQNFCDVSSLSQAYVFYKLSQAQVINLYKYKFRSVFEYHGRPLFLKNEIKDYFFGVQGIFHSKLKHKNPPNSVMNQWTNWLKGHYQYDLSQSGWSRLVPQKWRNRMNEHHVAKNKDLTKCHSYEKNRLILYKKQEVGSLTNKKKKIKKQYGYDLLSYKSINYADKKDSYIYGYRSPFQANNNQAISYNYNTCKKKLFDMTDDIPIKNYIVKDSILDMEKNLDRKYFDWRILTFCLRNKVDFGAWIDTNYYFTFHQEINPSNQKRFFFDWMGMNVEILNRSIANREFFFFSKFFRFYNAYTSNPWIIPIKLLFFNFNVNKNVNEKKNITERKKIDIFRPSKKKKEKRNQGKTEYAGRVNLEESLSKKEKDVKEDYAGSDMKKGVKEKKYKNNIEAELNCFLRRYLLFQLNWCNCLNERIMNNIKVYCLLLRLINLKEIAIASIQRGELSLDIMKIQNQTDFTLTELNKNKELMKKEILSIEPTRLFRKNHEQFLMYQTISLSLIHKKKHQINQRYREKKKSYVDTKNFEKSIPRTTDQKLTENKEKNHYDLLVPENILSARRRRELRILICFNPRNRNSVHRNTTFYNENKVNNCCQVLATSKDLDRDNKKLINLKLFLWPNYRLEDLACMNRYWFDTNNGSRFSMVRIHMYPRLKIRQSTFFFFLFPVT